MIAAIRHLLEKHLESSSTAGEANEGVLSAAAAVLLMEVARADQQVDVAERAAVQEIVRQVFSLSPEQAAEISAQAEKKAENAVSLYPFTRTLVHECSMDERIEIVSRLWQVAYADGRLEAHEEYLIRKIADLLYVPHSQFIRGKLQHSGDN